jgi:hypothetical protein
LAGYQHTGAAPVNICIDCDKPLSTGR